MQYFFYTGRVGYCPVAHLHADVWRILLHIPISIISEHGNWTRLSRIPNTIAARLFHTNKRKPFFSSRLVWNPAQKAYFENVQ